jgi:hypothetical protein
VIEESYIITYKNKPTNENAEKENEDVDSLENAMEVEESDPKEEANERVKIAPEPRVLKEKAKSIPKNKKDQPESTAKPSLSEYTSTEKLKPEESFHYEYEQLIEQPTDGKQPSSATKHDKDKTRWVSFEF